MTSEAEIILRRSRKPIPLWKKLSAVTYGIVLMTMVVIVLSNELWTELGVPLVTSRSMQGLKWAQFNKGAYEHLSHKEDAARRIPQGPNADAVVLMQDADSHVLYANSEEDLQALAPSVAKIVLTWTITLVVVVGVGAAVGALVLKLGYFAGAARIVTLIFFTVFGLTMVIPFFWMVSMALKSLQETSLVRLDWIPWPIRWRNFKEVFDTVPYARFYLNSMFMASYVTVGLIFTSSLAAYSFARLNFPGRDKLFLAYLATMMIPGAVMSIPVFVLMCKIGWVDCYRAIIIPGIFSAYGTFMLRQFFMSLPRDLEDAAKIDGCSLFGIFFRIIIPLSKPALATLTIFTFMGSWRNFMWPLIILNDPGKMPLPVGLQFFASSEAPDPNVLMAATMMMIVPVIIVFLMGQRYFVEGIQLGAVKG
ncbi:MAG: carbohydrate ABC transporter permease [Planctomycetes bacterium]|nr:carbohydrate ABC transporter permease [Planctomycetota bacterium]